MYRPAKRAMEEAPSGPFSFADMDAEKSRTFFNHHGESVVLVRSKYQYGVMPFTVEGLYQAFRARLEDEGSNG